MNAQHWKTKSILGHAVLLIAISGWLIWYAADTWQASQRLENVVLILPSAVLGLCLTITLLVLEVRASRKTTSDAGENDGPREEAPDDLHVSLALMCLLGAYVGTMSWIGLDVATFFFVAFSLVLLNERRLLVILGFSAGFTVLTIGAMGQLVNLPGTLFMEWMLP